MDKDIKEFILKQFEILNNKLDALSEAIANAKKYNQQDLGDWLTNEQVQTLLELGNTSLWTFRTTGKIKFSKIGERVYYSKQSILAYLEKNKT